ncbi:MAG: DEAD/DEAH box helicase family protein [Bacteroidales bacterium]
MINLHPEQQRTKKAIYDFFKQGGKHCLAYGPPRFGKTVIFSKIAYDFARHERNVLVITDQTELLDQSGKTLKGFDLPVFYIEAGCKHINKNYRVHVGMTRTLENRIHKPYWRDLFQNFWDLIMIDEAHLQTFNNLFINGILKDKWVIGWTGTPHREGKMRQLGLDYETIIQEVTISELLEKERLVNCDIATSSPPDTTKVDINTATGDYNTKQLYGVFDKRALYAGVVKDYKENVPGTKFICYCINKVHAIKTAIDFYEKGVDVRFIVSPTEQPKEPGPGATPGEWTRYREKQKDYELYKKWFPILSGNRDKVFQDFRDNKFKGLINVEMATKGFDCPDVETIILNYKTKRLTKYLQSALRGATACPPWKSHFNLRDFGDNVAEFGDPLKERKYSIWHEEAAGGGLPPVKECGYNSDGQPINTNGRKGCRRLIHAGYNICPFCGFKYPGKNLSEIDLHTIMQTEAGGTMVMKKTKRIKDMNLDELYEYWQAKKHNKSWLYQQLWWRGGYREIERAGVKFGWSRGRIEKAKSYCEILMKKIKTK